EVFKTVSEARQRSISRLRRTRDVSELLLHLNSSPNTSHRERSGCNGHCRVGGSNLVQRIASRGQLTLVLLLTLGQLTCGTGIPKTLLKVSIHLTPRTHLHVGEIALRHLHLARGTHLNSSVLPNTLLARTEVSLHLLACPRLQVSKVTLV